MGKPKQKVGKPLNKRKTERKCNAAATTGKTGKLRSSSVSSKAESYTQNLSTSGAKEEYGCCQETGSIQNISTCTKDSEISYNSQQVCCDHELTRILADENKICRQYGCGSCRKKFSTICQLHSHLLGSHKTGGSYHYDNFTQMAFPKYDTFCSFTQTDDDLGSFGRLEHDIKTDTAVDNENSAFAQIAESKPIINLTDTAHNVVIAENGIGYSSEILSTNSLQETSGDQVLIKVGDDSAAAHINDVIDSDVADDYVEMEDDQDFETCGNGKMLLESTTKLLTSDVSTALEKTNTKATKNKQVVPKLIKNEVISPEKPAENVDVENKIISKGFTCELCGSVFSFKRGLLRHEQRKHVDALKFSCEYCDSKYLRESSLQMHVKGAHIKVNKTSKQNLIDKAVEKTDVQDDAAVMKGCSTVSKKKEKEELQDQKAPHTCDICGYTMPRSKMDVHQRLHSGERPFICKICGKGLISQNKLKRHMLIHSDVKKHTCELCGVGFQMKYKLQMHMHIHTGKKPYLCSICGAEFNNSSNLANHTRCVHLQVKPFVCPTCGGCYAKRSQLDDHILSHSTEKQFTCRYCGKSFKYFKGMRRHEKNHSEEKGYKCGQCDMVFFSRDTLEQHQSNHKTTIHCQTCKKVFPNIKALKIHETSVCRKKYFSCLICGETYKASNQYYTHMLAAHDVDREHAKQLYADDCARNNSLIASSRVDPNLPLQINTAVSKKSEVRKEPHSVLNGFEVSQVVSGLMEDNHLSLNAMTRVATENLRLHSEDFDKHEPISSLQTVARSLTDSQILTAVRNVSCSIGGDKLPVSTTTCKTLSPGEPVFHMSPTFKVALKFTPAVPMETNRHLSHQHVQQQQQPVSLLPQQAILRPVLMSQTRSSNYAPNSLETNTLGIFSGPRPVQDVSLLPSNSPHPRLGDQSVLQQQQQQQHQPLEATQALGTLALVASTESSLLQRETTANPERQNMNHGYRIQNLY